MARVYKKYLQRLWIRLRSFKLETIFLVIFLPFGLLFVAMIPPGWNTDEPDHTYRIYQLSRGNLLSEPVISPFGNHAFGGEVPAGLVNLYKDAGVRDAGASAVDKTKKANDLVESHPDITKYKSNGEKTNINFSGAALYSPVTYAFYIPVFWIGKLFSLSFFSILIIARIVGLLAVGLTIYFAIKYIKVGKWIVFFVGLLPTTIIQAASVGADGVLIGAALAFTAYWVNCVFNKSGIGLRHYLVLGLIGAILALMKLAYAPMLLLILVLPFVVRARVTKKSIITALIVTILALVPALVWTLMVSYIDTNSNLQANFPLQKEFILEHPLTYLKTLYYTFLTPMQTPLEGMYGTAIWGSVSLPAAFTFIASAIAVLTTTVKDPRELSLSRLSARSRTIWRVSLLATVAVTTTVIATALYIYSSTLHQSSIIGLQARYFVPLLPLILLGIYGNFIKNQKIVKVAIILTSTFLLIGMALIVYQRLYQVIPEIIL